MTVRTMPVQPVRSAGPAGPEPWPWQGMLWVTWRQHRGVLVSVPVAFAAAVAFMLVTGPKIRHDDAARLACHPAASAACAQLGNYFNSTDWHYANGIRVALLAAPVLLTMFAGPPVLGRELENGTFRYAWTQGIGRVRWTITKLVFLGSLVTILAFAASQLFTWYFAPFLAAQNLSVLTPSVFGTRALSYPAWTLTAFCLGAFLGMLIRRVLPAMAAALAVYAALTAATWLYLRDHYPVRTFWPMQVFEASWLLVLSLLLIVGTVRLVRRHAT
jgi:hypothetical protein